jgi:hypothetical protein
MSGGAGAEVRARSNERVGGSRQKREGGWPESQGKVGRPCLIGPPAAAFATTQGDACSALAQLESALRVPHAIRQRALHCLAPLQPWMRSLHPRSACRTVDSCCQSQMPEAALSSSSRLVALEMRTALGRP